MSATLTAPTSRISFVREVISEQFVQSLDGMWYPAASGEPLVRISVSDREYRVERRRNVNAAWTGVLTATLAEFEAESFRTWAERWPLVTN